MGTRDLDAAPWAITPDAFPRAGSRTEQFHVLLRYAILAPSSHNTQPWRFGLDGDTIHLFADATRWLRVADPDQRELHLSLGCCLENLLIAAEHFGFGHEVAPFPDPARPTLVASVTLRRHGLTAPTRPAALFDAITVRHTNHRAYEARPILPDQLEQLQACCWEDGLRLDLTDDPAIKRAVDSLIVRADTIQFADPAWREELAHWIDQGVFGTPWLLAKLGQLAVSYLNMASGTAKQDAHLLLSAPVLGLLSAATDDRIAQLQAGQVFERLCLLATSLGIRVQPMNQIVQIPALKAEVAALIPAVGAIPQIPFRLGYAEPEARHTPRRPLPDVLTG
jgi:nitroreductase